jgi:uncharacterized protein YukE
MQVDTAALRATAGRLRREVLRQLEAPARAMGGGTPADSFCGYAGPEPYGEAVGAWFAEIQAIHTASAQLADALEAAADDYDRADAAAAGRLVAPR